MATCPNCGAANNDGTKFCTSCGGPLPVTQQPQSAQPVYQQPVQPAAQQPVYQQPVYQQPVYQQPIYQQPVYQQPAAQPPVDPQPAKNSMCTAGFVLSLIGIFTVGITSLFGLIFSVIGLITSGKKKQAGKGKAIAGIIMSVIMIIALISLYVFLASDYIDRAERVGDEISTTSTDEDPSAAYEKKIVKNKWITTGDGSYLVFNKRDNTFKYYMTYTDTTDNYYSGHYEIYTGKDAVEYITEDLEDYGVTKDELRQLFRSNDMYDKENLICICLNNEEKITDGSCENDDAWTTHYFGFYLVSDIDGKEFDVMDLTNMESASYCTFLREDQYDDYKGSGNITIPDPNITDTSETSDFTEVLPTYDYSDYETVGDSITGEIALTQGDWAEWHEADGMDSYYESRHQKINVETETIINLTVFPGEYDDAGVSLSADNLSREMESEGYKNLEVKKTWIGGYSAYEISGMYQDGMNISIWLFADRNNKLHFISVEYYPDDVASYEMVRDTYRLG